MHLRIPTVLLALLLSAFAPAARAQTVFTNADLAGQFAFTQQTTDLHGAVSDFGGDISLSAMGTFTADGEGNITVGVRRMMLPTTRSTGRTHGLVTQALSGTYTVEPDGTGTMTLTTPSVPTWTPTARWEVAIAPASETVQFVLRDGGHSMWLASTIQAHFTELLLPLRDLEVSVLLPGEAHRQDHAQAEAGQNFPGRGGHLGHAKQAWER